MPDAKVAKDYVLQPGAVDGHAQVERWQTWQLRRWRSCVVVIVVVVGGGTVHL